MLRNQLPADELAHVRGEIRNLRAREVELRKCFTEECDSGLFEGCDFDVEVRMQKRCVLNKNRLPAEILNDPQYFDIRYSPIVRVKPRKEPRLPLDCAVVGVTASIDSFDLIEAW
ncbi:hypothetical protein [Profundibacter sp.]